MIRLSPRPSLQATLLAAATLALAALVSGTHAASAQSPVSKNAAAAAPDSPYRGAVVEDIVARVNDQIISSSDFDHAEQDLDTQAKQHNFSSTDLDAQKRQLLRDLIDNQLLLSKGKQLGITGEAETIRQLDELRKQNHLDSMEALEKAAESQGVSFADFKASIQNRVITSQVIRDEVGRRINITQADEHQYYDDHKDQFTTPETVKLSEILIPTADPDNAAQVATAQTKADDVEAQLKSGKDFAAVAKADSGGSTAAQGGDLGEWKRGQLAKVLEDDTFDLKPGQFTAPIRTKQGFIILKVIDHNAPGLQPFPGVQPQVEDAVGMEKMQPALRQYLTHLREEAFIQVKPGYVDSGATTDEFRPIFSAYTPPQPKKKKKLARTRFDSRGRTRSVRVAKTAPAPATAAPSATGVPTLADVANGTATTSGATTGTTKPTQPTGKQLARVEKSGKREKVRFGQAPRESLPAADTRSEDAGASSANGNTSATETPTSTSDGTAPAETASAPQASGSPQTNGVPANAHYANGDSASEQQAVATKTKTRFSDRAVVEKVAKAKKKAQDKIDPYPAPPVDQQEVSDRKEQSTPLDLSGGAKPAAAPKPTTKTRFSDEAGKKPNTDDYTQPANQSTGSTGSTPAAATPATPSTGSDATPPPAQQPQQPQP